LRRRQWLGRNRRHWWYADGHGQRDRSSSRARSTLGREHRRCALRQRRGADRARHARTFPAGTYDIGIGFPGDDAPLLQLDDVALADGDDLVVVAYRTNGELPVNVFVFANNTEGLASGEGRVFVGHGANDSALDPVDISLGEEPDCSTLIPGFVFGTTAPADGLDLAEGTYQIGFDLTPDDMNDCADFGPVGVPVTRNVVSILIAVDEDTTDTSEDMNALNPELWAIIPDAEDPQPIRTIQTTP